MYSRRLENKLVFREAPVFARQRPRGPRKRQGTTSVSVKHFCGAAGVHHVIRVDCLCVMVDHVSVTTLLPVYVLQECTSSTPCQRGKDCDLCVAVCGGVSWRGFRPVASKIIRSAIADGVHSVHVHVHMRVKSFVCPHALRKTAKDTTCAPRL